MRNKLEKFTNFANTLLPHETEYLLNTQRFEDKVRLEILQRVHKNCQDITHFTPYDPAIDKRKYSHLKNWIIERLQAIDVDVHFEWMSDLEHKIMTDSIAPKEEKQLLKAIQNYNAPIFFFTKFYELVQQYRHFLLIRLRYEDYRLVAHFLKQSETTYQHAKEINEKLHLATLDIVNQYQENTAESKHWQDWLTKVFYDEKLDGLNRYLALVRLSFIGFNYRKFDFLLEKYDYLDQLFKKGQYYSKRLLLNYYNNRLLLHSKFQEIDKATYYGYLSIRAQNHDYLHYVNNLCAILLRQGKTEEALRVLKGASSEAKTTKNLHSKIGYVAFYVECLNKNGRYKAAENYAQTFLNAYKREVFEYRWHLFFSSYLEALLVQRKYPALLKVVRQNRLQEKEKNYQRRANYLPSIFWFNTVAEYKEGVIDKSAVESRILQFVSKTEKASRKLDLIKELLNLLKPHLPDIVRTIEQKASNLN